MRVEGSCVAFLLELILLKCYKSENITIAERRRYLLLNIEDKASTYSDINQSFTM
jgi:hypothetical protein